MPTIIIKGENTKQLLFPLESNYFQLSEMPKRLSNHLLIFLISPIFLVFNACEIINPSEDIPSYIQINGFHLNTIYGQGSASHQITDVWLYVDDQFTGAYQLPANIPVLANGVHKIQLRPGIILNGISSTRSIYPLYTSLIFNIDLKEGETVYIDSISDCVVSYNSDALFPWNDRGQEDFEEGGISIDSTGNSSTRIQKTSSEVFEGNFSGLIELNSTNKVFEGKSIDAFNLPLKGVTTFIELNYKCNNSFFVGYYANTTSGSGLLRKIIEIFPKSHWNKMYINLTPYINLETNPINFTIWIGATKNAGVDNPKIYIDNLKIVHY